MFPNTDQKTAAATERGLLKSRLFDMGRWLMSPPVEEPQADWQGWLGGGLTVDPSSFTTQLVSLQKSLHRAGRPALQPVAQPAVKRGAKNN